MSRILSEANVDYVLSKRFGSDYVQLEYIEGTGTQYIETDYWANSLTEVKLALSITEQNRQDTIFSSKTSTSSDCVNLFHMGSESWRFDFGSKQNTINARTLGVSSINMDRNTIRIQDNSVTVTNSRFFAKKFPMIIFATIKDDDTINTVNIAKAKLYYFTIFDNDVLVRYYIPCRNKNHIGLLDLVSGNFLESSTDSLIAGPDVTPINFPSNYRLVNRVIANSAIFNIGNLKLNGNSRIVARLVKNANGNNITDMFGTRTANGGQIILRWNKTAGNWRFFYGLTSNQQLWVEPDGIRYDRDLYIDFDGEKESGQLTFSHQENISFNKTSFTSQTNFLIFATGTGSESQNVYSVNGSFYFMRIYKDGIIVRNLWPMQRISDGVYGIYDTINDQFYTSINSSVPSYDSYVGVPEISKSSVILQGGSLEKPALVSYLAKSFGKDTTTMDESLLSKPLSIENLTYVLDSMAVKSDYTKIKWIQSTGTQYMQTGFVYNSSNYNKTVIKIKNEYQRNEESFWMVNGISHAPQSVFYIGRTNAISTLSYGNGQDNTRSDDLDFYTLCEWEYDTINKTLKLNGNVKANNITFTSPSAGYEFILFGYINNQNLYDCHAERIYEFSASVNGIEQCHLIPVIRNSDSMIGMYDTVNNKFLTNPGDGEFIAGPKF